MIDFKEREQRELAQTLARYIYAGKAEVTLVEDSYFSGQRWRYIFKKWRELRCWNDARRQSDHEIEIQYLRLCRRYNTDIYVSLGNWKPILEVVASRLQFYSTNCLALSDSHVKFLDRILKVAWALKHGI